MSDDFAYDPVTAVDEASATGRTAEIFADIRETMGIPLVTSIWRGLADMDGSLQSTWDATRPIFLSGHTEPALARMIHNTPLPLPPALPASLLDCAGIDRVQLASIRTIIDAYNRSNGMNLVALAALLSPAPTVREQTLGRNLPVWNTLPSLPSRQEVDPDTWDLVRHVNALGSSGLDAHVATLWRHLSRWPAFLSVTYTAFAPMQADGSVARAANQMVKLAHDEGRRLSAWRDPATDLTEPARKTITAYVTSPHQVARMVAIGHAMAAWLPKP